MANASEPRIRIGSSPVSPAHSATSALAKRVPVSEEQGHHRESDFGPRRSQAVDSRALLVNVDAGSEGVAHHPQAARTSSVGIPREPHGIPRDHGARPDRAGAPSGVRLRSWSANRRVRMGTSRLGVSSTGFGPEFVGGSMQRAEERRAEDELPPAGAGGFGESWIRMCHAGGPQLGTLKISQRHT